MMQNPELALPATIYRVGELEKKIKEIMDRIDNSNQAIGTQLNEIRACMVVKESLPTFDGKPLHEIIVPPELAFAKGSKFKKGKRFFRSSKNRTAEIVAKRWAMWRDQHNAGIPISVIARAWGCDHATILNAKARNWESYKPKVNSK